ncbi:hypothetical protein Tco_0184028 [Tanacetum coccineum]
MLISCSPPPAMLMETQAAKFVQDFKSLAKEADESLAKHKALELEIERLLRAVVSQDIMSIVQNPSVVDSSNLQTELDPYERTLGDQKGNSQVLIVYHNNSWIPLSQKLENENVELEFQTQTVCCTYLYLNSTAFPKVGETNALSNPVTSNSVPSSRESTVVNNERVIAPGIFRINPFKANRYVNGMKSRKKNQSANVSKSANQKKHKAQGTYHTKVSKFNFSMSEKVEGDFSKLSILSIEGGDTRCKAGKIQRYRFRYLSSQGTNQGPNDQISDFVKVYQVKDQIQDHKHANGIFKRNSNNTGLQGLKDVTRDPQLKDHPLGAIVRHLKREQISLYLETSEDNEKRKVEFVDEQNIRFYKECLELGPEYVTGMDDEGEVT